MATKVAVLERELVANRERYNTLFALARRMRPRLDGERFLENLRTLVAPIVGAHQEEAGAALVDPLYGLCLELSGGELFDRSPAVSKVWKELLPEAGSLLQERPAYLAAALSNAAYNVEGEGADWQSWLSQMKSLRERCDSSQQWLDAGKVVAWSCGLAHYRESSLAVGQNLPKELLQSIFEDWDGLVEDIWSPLRKPSKKPFVVHKVGGFVGFGGVFRRPPWVAHAGEGRFVVEDGTDEWLLSCDGFGATLKAGADPDIEAPERHDVHASDDGTIVWSGVRVKMPELAPVRTFAASEQVLAVTSELSHHVYLLLGPQE